MSLLTVGTWSGLALGPVIADVLLGEDRFMLVWLVAAGLATAAWLGARGLPDTRPEGDDAPAGWLPPRSSVAPGLVLFLAGIGFGGFNAFAALHAREVGLDHPGLVFLLCGGIVVAVRIFGRRLPDRLGPRVGATFATSTIACGLLVIGAWPTEAGLLAGVAIFGFGQALAYPSIILLAIARTKPAERSAAVGSTALFIDLSLAGGAFLLGWAANAYDYRAVFLAGSVAALIGLVVLRSTTARPVPVLESAP
jgi:predicted MFS family arabinose efflux permease